MTTSSSASTFLCLSCHFMSYIKRLKSTVQCQNTGMKSGRSSICTEKICFERRHSYTNVYFSATATVLNSFLDGCWITRQMENENYWSLTWNLANHLMLFILERMQPSRFLDVLNRLVWKVRNNTTLQLAKITVPVR